MLWLRSAGPLAVWHTWRGVLALLGAAAVVVQAAEYEQNCAARKLCNKPLALRDAELQSSPSAPSGALEESKAPLGHLMPVGHQSFDGVWEGEIEVVDSMAPTRFWAEFWAKKPFVLRGFAKQSRAFEAWKSDEYLRERYGDFKVKTEPKNEDRLTDYCGQTKLGETIRCGPDTIPYTETYVKLKKVLDSHNSSSFDKYVVTQMPDAMGADVLVPHFLSCMARDEDDPGPPEGGRALPQLYENNLWISQNLDDTFSSSVIHYDMNHHVMCQFDGSKEWLFWDMRTEASKIPMWSGYYDQASHTARGSDDSPVDAERVDLLRWPQFATARWWNVSLRAGDCLYQPAFLLHYVRTFGRGMAAMMLFRTSERPAASCGDEDGADGGRIAPRPLSAHDVLWSFPEEDSSLLGWDVVKMGFPDWKRRFLVPLAELSRAAPAKGGLSREEVAARLRAAARDAGALGAGGLAAWDARLSAALEDLVRRSGSAGAGASRSAGAASSGGSAGLIRAEALFRSRALRFLLKDLAVFEQGPSSPQDEGTEMDRYNLNGDVRSRLAEL